MVCVGVTLNSMRRNQAENLCKLPPFVRSFAFSFFIKKLLHQEVTEEATGATYVRQCDWRKDRCGS